VIKLGALGDFVQALHAMEAIRRAHAKARITLLTTPPYADLARATGHFDAIDVGGRPQGLREALDVARRLRAGGFERVYDLQTSSRSSVYFYAFAPRFPEWSGISRGASHRHRNPRRDRMQNLDRLWDQLAEAGAVDPLPPGQAPGPRMGWATAAAGPASAIAGRFGVRAPFALIAPGASPGAPRKRWPARNYAALAQALERMTLTPVVIGGDAETPLAETIAAAASSTVALTGKTTLIELAALGAGAALVVGNDTGPTYLASASGAPTVVLFSSVSDPDLCAPRWGPLTTLRSQTLGDLSVETVTKAVQLCFGAA
jgi:ADP-heptose:LPS heptosyltransferase